MQQESTKPDLRQLTEMQLLVYALAGDGEHPPPVEMVVSARAELGALELLVERSQPGIEIELGEILPALTGIGRRLDVAIELLTRPKVPAPEPREGCAARSPTAPWREAT